MEKVAGKLDAIAKELIEIFMENGGKKYCDGIQEKETVLALHRYDHNTLLMEKNSVLSNEKNEYGDALTLHLSSQYSQFHVQSKRGPLSFEQGPDTIVVTVGKQLEVTLFYILVVFLNWFFRKLVSILAVIVFREVIYVHVSG